MNFMADPNLTAQKPWFVYILRCADDTLYTGVSTDVARRVDEHNAGAPLGARYTRARRPVVLVYQESVASRSEALRRELEIKAKDRAAKLALIASRQ
jgi:putative endonuclease